MKKLLINYVYYSPVGHLLEAIKHAKGYYEANKDLQISLLVNSETPIELAKACDWIDSVYSISTKEVLFKGKEAESIKVIPKDWDYVLVDHRVDGLTTESGDDWLGTVQSVLQEVFVGKEINGPTPKRSWKSDEDVSLKTPLPYKLNAHIEIPLPKDSKDFVKKYINGEVVITILPSGSAGLRQSPSLEMWEKICIKFAEAIPGVKINFTGVTKSEVGRTATQDISHEDIDKLVKKLPNAENCFNIGLWNQVALIEASDIFCSPHSGFSFVSQVIGTPWLAISGCPWPEYFFNDTPFYSVLPDCQSYPSKLDEKSDCGKLLFENKKTICMQDNSLLKKIPEIIKGARMLLDSNFTYHDAIELHLQKIKDSGRDINKFFFFDGIKGIKE